MECVNKRLFYCLNPNTECYLFNKNMNIGSNGNDVLMLQKLLNQNGFTLAASGAGSAGNRDKYVWQSYI